MIIKVIIIAFLISLILTSLLIKILKKLKILDNPTRRKIHKVPTPHLGGLAIFISFFITIISFYIFNSFLDNFLDFKTIWFILISASIIIILGIIDDTKGLGASSKFTFQIIASLILYIAGFRIDVLTNPFGGSIELDLFSSILITLFWMCAIINALNLIDGLDGLATGVSAIACFFLLVIAIARTDILTIFISASLLGSCLGFLIFNFHPAKIFLGDTGSMFLGFIFGFMGLSGYTKSATVAALLIPIGALAIPVIDMIAAILRRSKSGKNIFKADKLHLHHRIYNLLLSQRKAVLLIYLICVYFGLLSWLSIFLKKEYAILLVSFVFFSVLIFFILLHKWEIRVYFKRNGIK